MYMKCHYVYILPYNMALLSAMLYNNNGKQLAIYGYLPSL